MARNKFYHLNYNKFTAHRSPWKQPQYDEWWERVKDMPFNPDFGVFAKVLRIDRKGDLTGPQ